ncbi:hypothetical protein [Desulfosporosinus fructosivorans]
MKVLKMRKWVISSVMFAVISITPISMAYAQNATAKDHVEGPGYSTKVPVENSVDSSKLEKGEMTTNSDSETGYATLDAYNMAPNLPRTMEAAYKVDSLIGPISSVRLYITFDDGKVVTDKSSVWQWFNTTYANATQHQFSTTGEHKVSLVGTAWVNAGALTINYTSISTKCVLTN